MAAAPGAVGALPARKGALLADLLGSLLVLSLWVTRAAAMARRVEAVHEEGMHARRAA